MSDIVNQNGRGKVTANSVDTVVVFDYALLDPETRIKVEQKTGEIKTIGKRVASDICDMGGKFYEVRELLRHNKSGGFDGWIEVEGFGRSFVYNCVAVYEQFNNRPNFGQLDIAISALYLMTNTSTPARAKEEILERAESGEKITHKKAAEIIQEHKPVTAPPKTKNAVTYTTPIDDFVDDVPAVEIEPPVTRPSITSVSAALPGSAFSKTLPQPGSAALIQPGKATELGHDDGYASGFNPQGGESPRPAPAPRTNGRYAVSGDHIVDENGCILSLHDCVIIMNMKAGARVIETVEVVPSKPLLVKVAADMDISPDKLAPFANEYKTDAARLGLELVELIGKKKADITAYMDALIQAVVVEKPTKKEKKPTTPKAVFNAMVNAIVDAMGWDQEDITVWGDIQKAAKLLCNVNASPDDMEKVHAYCKSRFDNFGVMSLAKYYADWKASQPKPVVPQSNPDEWVPMPPEAKAAWDNLLTNSFKFDDTSSEQVPA